MSDEYYEKLDYRTCDLPELHRRVIDRRTTKKEILSIGKQRYHWFYIGEPNISNMHIETARRQLLDLIEQERTDRIRELDLSRKEAEMTVQHIQSQKLETKNGRE